MASRTGKGKPWPLPFAVLVLLASCATVPPAVPGGGAPGYRNPVLDRDFPDPAVLRDGDGWFYAYATQSASAGRMINIQVARSPDLVQWQHLGDALPDKPRWAATKQNFWAPHVVHDPDLRRYVMYYSAEPDWSGGKCLAVATASTPAGPFADTGEPLLCGARFENIDPMAFDDPATGKRLLFWGSAAKPIRVRELAPDRVHFLPGSEARDVLPPDPQRDYRSLVEGAWVHYRDGWYYLFYSGDRCCGPNAHYALMVARARAALGPYEDMPEPLLAQDAAWRAPGHNCVVTDDAGSDWVLYHAMRAGSPGAERLMLLDRLTYADGWPRAAGGGPSFEPMSPPAIRIPIGEWLRLPPRPVIVAATSAP